MENKTQRIYTVGHSNRLLTELIGLLAEVGIRCLVDVRRYPTSKRYPHFNTENLRHACKEAGITYHWAGEQLGGYRSASPDSPHVALNEGLRGYADYMGSEAFLRNISQLTELATQQATAILCAEKHPQDCHRQLIADYLCNQGVAVTHLIDGDVRMRHELSGSARNARGMLVYDRLTQQSLPFDT